MTSPAITLRVWRVPRSALPRALWRMARDRGRLRRAPGVAFAKLLGTGTGFSPWAADPTRWAVVVCGALPGPVGEDWGRIAAGWCELELRPIAVRGRWSGVEPFGSVASGDADGSVASGDGDGPVASGDGDGPVVALTRARLRPSRVVRFWRAVPAIAADLAAAPGLLASFGIGEAPIGWQGTVSVWASAGHLTAFAYRTAAHRDAIRRTPAEDWYAEELFARFHLTAVRGDRAVLGWDAAR